MEYIIYILVFLIIEHWFEEHVLMLYNEQHWMSSDTYDGRNSQNATQNLEIMTEKLNISVDCTRCDVTFILLFQDIWGGFWFCNFFLVWHSSPARYEKKIYVTWMSLVCPGAKRILVYLGFLWVRRTHTSAWKYTRKCNITPKAGFLL